MRYVDVEAIRAIEPAPQGLEGALREAWRRYRLPIAVTEAHNGCTRDEQMRWLARAWSIAGALRAEGADIRAVTSWALLGSIGWNRLLTEAGAYETGAFDVRGGSTRSTALVPLLRDLASGRALDSIAAGPGWWERPIRFHHAPVPRPARVAKWARAAGPWQQAPPVMICGATGTLGQALASACAHRGLAFVATSRAELSLDDAGSVEAALDRYRPWAMINAAGWVRVDAAESEEQACFAANATGAARLARACDTRGIRTVSFSSDLVFGNTVGRAWHEDDAPEPLNAYGRSKRAAEQSLAALPGTHLVVRTAAFFSPYTRYNFAWALIDALRRGEPFQAASDHIVSPTYVPQLADAVLDLAIDGEGGLWHLTNGEETSWSDFGASIARACRLDPVLVEAVPGASLGWIAERPKRSSLVSRRGAMLRPLDAAIAEFAAVMDASPPARLAG